MGYITIVTRSIRGTGTTSQRSAGAIAARVLDHCLGQLYDHSAATSF